MKSSASVAILMATYNGERFIAEQLESLLAQTYDDWHLYIHDDSSCDDTIKIIKRYQAINADKITLLDYPSQGGAMRNFMSLLERVESRYYMFCDQDDIWHDDKIEKSVEAMMQREGNTKAVLVHTDLRVVDASKELISPSFWNMMHIEPNRYTRLEQYVINVATGCTMIFNDAVRTAALSVDWDRAVMHDVWIMLRTVSVGGDIYGLNTPLIDYRQHETNSVGAQNASRLTLMYRLRNIYGLLRKNIRYYRMMCSAGYDGGVCEYIKNKRIYSIK